MWKWCDEKVAIQFLWYRRRRRQRTNATEHLNTSCTALFYLSHLISLCPSPCQRLRALFGRVTTTWRKKNSKRAFTQTFIELFLFFSKFFVFTFGFSFASSSPISVTVKVSKWHVHISDARKAAFFHREYDLHNAENSTRSETQCARVRPFFMRSICIRHSDVKTIKEFSSCFYCMFYDLRVCVCARALPFRRSVSSEIGRLNMGGCVAPNPLRTRRWRANGYVVRRSSKRPGEWQ